MSLENEKKRVNIIPRTTRQIYMNFNWSKLQKMYYRCFSYRCLDYCWIFLIIIFYDPL